MSDRAEKLEQASKRSTAGPARCTLAQLHARWGRQGVFRVVDRWEAAERGCAVTDCPSCAADPVLPLEEARLDGAPCPTRLCRTCRRLWLFSRCPWAESLRKMYPPYFLEVAPDLLLTVLHARTVFSTVYGPAS